LHSWAVRSAKLVLHRNISRSIPTVRHEGHSFLVMGAWPFGPLDPPLVVAQRSLVVNYTTYISQIFLSLNLTGRDVPFTASICLALINKEIFLLDRFIFSLLLIF